MIKKSFADTLRQQRAENHWTQEYTAAKADIAYRFFQEIEYGQKQPTLETLFKLAKVLEITPDRLIMSTWKAWLDDTNNNTKN